MKQYSTNSVDKILIAHFFNEEYLLPWWVKHHKKYFKNAILIDYHSTDRSRSIIENLAPEWEVRLSRNKLFAAHEVDEEVMEIEREFDGWKIALNITEFLCCDDLDRIIDEEARLGRKYFNARGIVMVDPPGSYDKHPDYESHLVAQRSHGFFERAATLEYTDFPTRSRMIHSHRDGAYLVGRHRSHHGNFYYRDDLLILWFAYSPWNEFTLKRKLQIKHKRPRFDIENLLGSHHDVESNQLEDMRLREAKKSTDLSGHPLFANSVKIFEERKFEGRFSAGFLRKAKNFIKEIYTKNRKIFHAEVAADCATSWSRVDKNAFPFGVGRRNISWLLALISQSNEWQKACVQIHRLHVAVDSLTDAKMNLKNERNDFHVRALDLDKENQRLREIIDLLEKTNLKMRRDSEQNVQINAIKLNEWERIVREKDGLIGLLHEENRQIKEKRDSFKDKYASGQLTQLKTILLGHEEAKIKRDALKTQAEMIEKSCFFDAKIYTGSSEAAQNGISSAMHYLVVGEKLGWKPSNKFDPSAYAALNPDVLNAEVGPLSHYLLYGAGENRVISAPESLKNEQERADELLVSGSEYFSSAFYMGGRQAFEQGISAALHYIRFGEAAGLRPSKKFDPLEYARINPDVANSGQGLLLHYLRFGIYEGRAAHIAE